MHFVKRSVVVKRFSKYRLSSTQVIMGRAERKRMHNRMKTKRKTKDADQIEEDMKPENVKKLLNQDVDYDVTGNGQFYCVHCA